MRTKIYLKCFNIKLHLLHLLKLFTNFKIEFVNFQLKQKTLFSREKFLCNVCHFSLITSCLSPMQQSAIQHRFPQAISDFSGPHMDLTLLPGDANCSINCFGALSNTSQAFLLIFCTFSSLPANVWPLS